MPTEMNSTATRFGRAWVVVSLLLGLVRCTIAGNATTVEPPSSDLLHAEPWPEADVLFRSDPRWLGADDAHSVDLGGGRVLWLFADTFVSTARPGWPRLLPARRTAAMIRNSVAIQSGYDPSTASIAFYWRGITSAPMPWYVSAATARWLIPA